MGFFVCSIFFFVSLGAVLLGPIGCTGWQAESPWIASVLLTNESYQKVNKQQRLYEKWHKWKRSGIAGRCSVHGDFSCLFTAHGRVTLHRGIQGRTPLNVPLLTEPIKSKTSQTCLESNLRRTWGHFAQVWNCGTLQQQQSFLLPCLPLALCRSSRWEESCLFSVTLMITWRLSRGSESLAFQSQACSSDTCECA